MICKRDPLGQQSHGKAIWDTEPKADRNLALWGQKNCFEWEAVEGWPRINRWTLPGVSFCSCHGRTFPIVPQKMNDFLEWAEFPVTDRSSERWMSKPREAARVMIPRTRVFFSASDSQVVGFIWKGISFPLIWLLQGPAFTSLTHTCRASALKLKSRACASEL